MSNIEIVDIADLDCVYLSYDEPLKEEFWAKIQNMVPWAVRVDGVKGSDAAHKAAADASSTDRFILIDGDNMPDPRFFDEQLVLTDLNKDCVFRWRAVNDINGLMYGNGGMSCWTKDFVYNMKTHENSNGSAETAVEFCFDPKYIAMHNVYSTTHPNSSAFHAWRAGFREGVKMCLDRGSKIPIADFKERANKQNLTNLLTWHNVGRDAQFGEYAMFGARLGTKLTMLTDWDYTEVQDFDKLAELWDSLDIQDVSAETVALGDELRTKLSLDIVELDARQSSFVKHLTYATHRQKNVMLTEQDFNSRK
jgi:hypothetical protein